MHSATLVNEKGERPPIIYLITWPHAEHPLADLATGLGADQPVWCVDPPPAAASGEVPNLDGWVRWYREQIDLLALEPPYRLAGWSFGGVVAFELARRLDAEGLRVDWLAMLDTWRPVREPSRVIPFLAQQTAAAYERFGGRRERLGHVAFHLRRFWAWRVRRARNRVNHKLARLRSRGVAPATMDEARRGVQVAWVHYQATATFLPVELFTTAESAEHWRGDLSLGWSAFLQGGYRVRLVAGGHRTMFIHPHGAELVVALRRSLETIDEGVAGQRVVTPDTH